MFHTTFSWHPTMCTLSSKLNHRQLETYNVRRYMTDRPIGTLPHYLPSRSSLCRRRFSFRPRSDSTVSPRLNSC